MATEPESPLFFDCAGAQLLGILHHGTAGAQRAVLVVVGGPQYRVGSHRQFVLLARYLAGAGIPTLRFDSRGMGDSAGDVRSFEDIQDDIAAAIDCLFNEIPSLRDLVLWGLCDAAAACATYASGDKRVAGLVLLNPWVRTDAGVAKAYLRHYYTKRLLSRAFWSKLFSGGVHLKRSLRALLGFLRSAKGLAPGGSIASPLSETTGVSNPDDASAPGRTPLPQRMLRGLNRFRGPVLLILSGNDLTAKEFEGLLKADRSWSRWVKQALVTRRDLADADHTFSTTQWRAQVETWTLGWLRSW